MATPVCTYKHLNIFTYIYMYIIYVLEGNATVKWPSDNCPTIDRLYIRILNSVNVIFSLLGNAITRILVQYFAGSVTTLKVLYSQPMVAWISHDCCVTVQRFFSKIFWFILFIYWIRNKHSALINNDISSLAWMQELVGLIALTLDLLLTIL